MSKALVIQTAFLGDLVLTTPLLRALVERGYEVDVLCTPAGAAVLSGLPKVNAIVFEKKTMTGIQSFLFAKRNLQKNYDKIFCVHRSLRSLVLGRIPRAQQAWAYSNPLAKLLCYDVVKYLPYAQGIHYVDRVLSMANRGLINAELSPGALSFSRTPWLTVTKPEAAGVKDRFNLDKKTKPYLVVSPYSAWGTKIWPIERHVAAGYAVAEKRGFDMVILGDHNHQNAEIDGILSKNYGLRPSGAPRVVNLCGLTSVGDLKAILAGASLLITNDSAPVHIAAAFDVPTVCVFGPTAPLWGFYPLSTKHAVVQHQDLSCRPCHIHGPRVCPLEHFRCMKDIQAEQVIQAALNITHI